MIQNISRLTICVLCLTLATAACASAAQVTSPAVSAQSTTEPGPEAYVRPAPPVLGQFDPASVSGIEIGDYPVIPEVNPAMRAIYQVGLARGNNAHVFSKLGDCMTETPYFLAPFGAEGYDLEEYGYLAEVIAQFYGHPARGEGWGQDSFETIGLAAASGFNIAGPLDPTWANPEWCQASESPLACEYRVARPSLAVIMFGTNDVVYTDAATYDFYLRTVVIETLDRDIVPILSTFPVRLEDVEKSRLLNQVVIRVAADYGVPLMNLNRALEPLPNYGVDPADPIRLSTPPDKRVDRFTGPNLQAGFTIRNLVTLQALDAVWRAVR